SASPRRIAGSPKPRAGTATASWCTRWTPSTKRTPHPASTATGPSGTRAARRRNEMSDRETTTGRPSARPIVVAAVLATIAAASVAALLINVFERKQEAKNPFYRVVDITLDTVDPAIWGRNFPLQYDTYARTVDMVRTRYGGSEAIPRT